MNIDDKVSDAHDSDSATPDAANELEMLEDVISGDKGKKGRKSLFGRKDKSTGGKKNKRKKTSVTEESDGDLDGSSENGLMEGQAEGSDEEAALEVAGQVTEEKKPSDQWEPREYHEETEDGQTEVSADQTEISEQTRQAGSDGEDDSVITRKEKKERKAKEKKEKAEKKKKEKRLRGRKKKSDTARESQGNFKTCCFKTSGCRL